MLLCRETSIILKIEEPRPAADVRKPEQSCVKPPRPTPGFPMARGDEARCFNTFQRECVHVSANPPNIYYPSVQSR
jgi:hypothetical protein